MSYAIIRNAKYKRENLMAVYRHNERKNKHYSNKDIDKTKSYLNYSLKEPEFNYVKEFDKIIKEYDLKGQIKIVSNIACEYMITKVIKKVKRIEENENIWLEMVNEPIFLEENYIEKKKKKFEEFLCNIVEKKEKRVPKSLAVKRIKGIIKLGSKGISIKHKLHKSKCEIKHHK